MSDGITDARRESSIQDRIDYFRWRARLARQSGAGFEAYFYRKEAERLEQVKMKENEE